MAAPSPTTNINTSPLAAAQVATYYGPNTQNALRRSQYLADALRQLSAEGGQNIRSPAELAAKLGATFLLSRANDKGQDALVRALKGDQDAETKQILAGFGDASQPPAPPISLPQAQPPPQAPAQQAPTPDVPPPPPPPNDNGPAFQPAVSPQDKDALTRMLAVEAGGEGPQGMAAAAHVALNRLKNGYGGAKSLSDVVYQPHQFEGISKAGRVSPQDYAHAAQVADAVLSGQVPDPTNGAMAFLNPDLQVKLGRQIPKWAQGQGLRIGNHVFFGGQAPDGQMTSTPAPQGPLSVAPTMADAQAPQPYQVASNGPTPPPPSALGSSPPDAGAPPAAGPPQATAAGGMPQWPTQKPSHAEYEYVQRLLMDPRTHAEGVQEARKLQYKMTQPVPSKIVQMNGLSFYVPDVPGEAPTMAIPVPKEAMTQTLPAQQAGLPNAPNGLYVQRDPVGNLKDAPGAPPPGFQSDGRGGLAPLHNGPGDPMRPQPPAQGYQYLSGSDGQPRQAVIPGSGADPKAPQNILQGASTLQKDLRPTIDLAVVARQSYGAVQTGYQQQNGAGDIAMVNGLQHLIDKGVVRGEDVNMQMKSNGLAGSIGSVQQFLNSGGLLTPEQRQKVLKTATDLFGNVDAQYRAQVMGNRQTFDAGYGDGAFDKYVMPAETAKALGWNASAAAPAAPAAQPALPPPHPGSVDAGILEAARRGLPLTPAQRERAKLYGVGR